MTVESMTMTAIRFKMNAMTNVCTVLNREVTNMDELKTEKDGIKMSVADEIIAWSLINIRDIFDFVMTANDDEIVERYGSEEKAVNIAEKYLEIGLKVRMLQFPIEGWSMKYSQPIKGKDGKRVTKEAVFYAKTGDEDA